MANNTGRKKILVLFVEPMHYGFDLIREVYEKTEYTYQYVYCYASVTGKDGLSLPNKAVICSGDKKERRKQIAQIFQAFQPDFAVINGYVGTEQVAAIKYCKKHRIPHAIESDTPLHIPSSKLKALLKKFYLQRLLGSKYCYAFPGGTLQKENFLYYGMPEDKCFIMPMSISDKRLLKEKESLPSKEAIKEKYGFQNKTVFLFVGRLTEVKNVSILIDAFAKLKEKDENIALCLVGDGNLKQELQAQVQKLGVQDVLFTGYVGFPQNVEYYQMADVFVLPSQHEPWGLVINEAMIMGLPVIVSSKVGCRKDLVQEGKNGFVFEDGNVEQLTCVMENIMQKDMQELARYSLAMMQQWNFEYYLQCFLGAIENARNKDVTKS